MCAVAVSEEILFRGVIFRFIQAAWGGTWIALGGASAAAFGLVHLINPGATLWGGALAVAAEAGLLLGAAFVATGSLWLPIGLHLAGTSPPSGGCSARSDRAARSRRPLPSGDVRTRLAHRRQLRARGERLRHRRLPRGGTALFLRLAHRRGRMVPARRKPTRSQPAAQGSGGVFIVAT